MEMKNKRHLDDGDYHLSDNTKKHKIDHDPSTSETKLTKEVIGFQNLCDDVIIHIFKYVSNSELAMMTQ